MYRAIIATFAITAILAATAIIAVASHFQSEIAEAHERESNLRKEMATMRQPAPSAPVAKDDLTTLSQENADLLLKISELEKTLESVRGQLAKADAALTAQSEFDPIADSDPVIDSLADTFDDAADDARREEWQARREEFAAIAQQRMNDLMANAIADAKNPREAERLAAMQEHMNHITTLVGEMRLVETEEERDAYREAIGQTRDTIRELANQQERADMRQIASDFDIPDDQQDAFFEALESARENPVLRSPFLTGGGRGRGGPGGGRGGGPRGGQ